MSSMFKHTFNKIPQNKNLQFKIDLEPRDSFLYRKYFDEQRYKMFNVLYNKCVNRILNTIGLVYNQAII